MKPHQEATLVLSHWVTGLYFLSWVNTHIWACGPTEVNPPPLIYSKVTKRSDDHTLGICFGGQGGGFEKMKGSCGEIWKSGLGTYI